MSIKEQYVIELERPTGVSPSDMQEYIVEAVQGWKGGFCREDALTDLDRRTVRCVSFRKVK